LADLIARCLAVRPVERYPSAGELAADLRRHLADLPLRGVVNRSPAERWGKWRRRRPYALPLLALVLTAIAGSGFLLAHVNRQTDKAHTILEQANDHLEQRRYAEAHDAFRHASALAEDLPFNADLMRGVRQGLHRAEQGKARADLHDLCERVRPLYGVDLLPEAQARAVARQCRRFWEERAAIARLLGQQGGLEAEQVRVDLLDLAILGAHLHVSLAPGRASREQALTVLAEAEELFGPSCVLAHERRLHALALGQAAVAKVAAGQADALPPRSAWEHYALGRAHLHAGDLPRARAQMERALERQPQALWPNFYQGSCAHRLGQYEDAVVAFSVCVVLAPRSGWCFHNRGLANLELGRLDRARADFDRALAMSPDFAASALARGTLHYRAGRYPEALADLERARRTGLDGAVVYYHEALVHLARKDRPAARTSLRHALRCDPRHRSAGELLARLQAEGAPSGQ
jgi:tetratricopeptide (TPR) repeat protein